MARSNNPEGKNQYTGHTKPGKSAVSINGGGPTGILPPAAVKRNLDMKHRDAQSADANLGRAIESYSRAAPENMANTRMVMQRAVERNANASNASVAAHQAETKRVGAAFDAYFSSKANPKNTIVTAASDHAHRAVTSAVTAVKDTKNNAAAKFNQAKGRFKHF